MLGHRTGSDAYCLVIVQYWKACVGLKKLQRVHRPVNECCQGPQTCMRRVTRVHRPDAQDALLDYLIGRELKGSTDLG